MAHIPGKEGGIDSVSPAGHEPSHHWLRDRDSNVLNVTLGQDLE